MSTPASGVAALGPPNPQMAALVSHMKAQLDADKAAAAGGGAHTARHGEGGAGPERHLQRPEPHGLQGHLDPRRPVQSDGQAVQRQAEEHVGEEVLRRGEVRWPRSRGSAGSRPRRPPVDEELVVYDDGRALLVVRTSRDGSPAIGTWAATVTPEDLAVLEGQRREVDCGTRCHDRWSPPRTVVAAAARGGARGHRDLPRGGRPGSAAWHCWLSAVARRAAEFELDVESVVVHLENDGHRDRLAPDGSPGDRVRLAGAGRAGRGRAAGRDRARGVRRDRAGRPALEDREVAIEVAGLAAGRATRAVVPAVPGAHGRGGRPGLTGRPPPPAPPTLIAVAFRVPGYPRCRESCRRTARWGERSGSEAGVGRPRFRRSAVGRSASTHPHPRRSVPRSGAASGSSVPVDVGSGASGGSEGLRR